MSNATTNAQALAEYLADLKRLNPKRADLLNAIDSACVTLQEGSSAQKRLMSEATISFLNQQKEAMEAHVEAELSAKDAVRGVFEAKQVDLLPVGAIEEKK